MWQPLAWVLPCAIQVTLTYVTSLLLRSPLVKAVLHTCKAMHASFSGKADGQQSSFCHCERASSHLWNSLNVSGATCDPTLNHVSGAYLAPWGGAQIWGDKNSDLPCAYPAFGAV